MHIRSALAFVRWSVLSAAAVLYLQPSPTRATTFTFVQTQSNVAGYEVDASISINGTLADLPTICNLSRCENPQLTGPYNFSPMLAFTLTSSEPPPLQPISLDDFTEACLNVMTCKFVGFPDWGVSPQSIFFVDGIDQNEIKITGFGQTSSIAVLSDFSGPCPGGGCVVFGYWEPVPEPASAPLLLSGMIAVIGLATFRGFPRTITRWRADLKVEVDRG